ncbi:unnamed protein product [Peronospora belbahrii]|uniref:Uncharacterized protein n=1 Tax=Peronospora belbahrii TaxID=622444 RepID=A0AAU9L3G0_9STRA|nr:unnamed protein product [Peronospora belbahrii]
MMALPSDEVSLSSLPSSPSNSTALVIKKNNEDLQLTAGHSDLELHLLQTFVAYTNQQLIHSYRSIKQASRVTCFLADMTEKLMSRSGLVTFVRLFYHQYMRLGHPFVQQVDDAMGKRVIDAVVSILMLSKQQSDHDKPIQTLALTAETDKKNEDDQVHDELLAATKLSYTERFQALLLGQVPRMEQALIQARCQLLEEATRQDLSSPVVMELKDFVPVEEVTKLKEESKELLQKAAMEVTRLQTEMTKLTQDKQQLEQRLTDVHNYQESERGRRFLEMEEELARTKLEANQKAYELRKLELITDARKSKHKKKSKHHKDDNRFNTSESAPPSSVPEKRSRKEQEGKRSRQNSNVTA